jgi:hypothetical protein
MRKDDDVRLRHMLDAAREALGFVRGRNRVDLNRLLIEERLLRPFVILPRSQMANCHTGSEPFRA